MIARFRLLLLPLVLAAPMLASPPSAEARGRSQLIAGDGVDANKNTQPRVKRHAAHPAPADGDRKSVV